MNRIDYRNLLNAYIEYADVGDAHDVTPEGVPTSHWLTGCTAEEAEAFAKDYAYEQKHNKAGMLALREKVAHLPYYVMVANHSTQVIVRRPPFGTRAVVVRSPHRNGLLRYAGEIGVLCYATDLETAHLVNGRIPDNVVQIVF
jgi:hypothetical protein